MFDSTKILHEVTYLLTLNNAPMGLLKLMKLLYLADRESIKERDYSISDDTYLSMQNGPVLSGALNMLYDLQGSCWGDYFAVSGVDCFIE